VSGQEHIVGGSAFVRQFGTFLTQQRIVGIQGFLALTDDFSARVHTVPPKFNDNLLQIRYQILSKDGGADR
jgi:hypothetical protein